MKALANGNRHTNRRSGVQPTASMCSCRPPAGAGPPWDPPEDLARVRADRPIPRRTRSDDPRAVSRCARDPASRLHHACRGLQHDVLELPTPCQQEAGTLVLSHEVDCHLPQEAHGACTHRTRIIHREGEHARAVGAELVSNTTAQGPGRVGLAPEGLPDIWR